MTRSSELLKAIKQTEAELEHSLAQTQSDLASPACYALPLAAFCLGLALHKSVPNPSKLLFALVGSPFFK